MNERALEAFARRFLKGLMPVLYEAVLGKDTECMAWAVDADVDNVLARSFSACDFSAVLLDPILNFSCLCTSFVG